MSPSTQRIPALHHNTQILNKWDYIIFLIIGMNLILHQCRNRIHLRQKFCQFLHIPVRQTNGTNFSFCHKLLHGFVCLHIIGIRVVKKHHIHIADIQTVQTRLNGLLRIFHFAARIDFCDNKNVLSPNNSFVDCLPDCLPDFLLIAVGRGSINKAHTIGQCGFYGIDTFIPVKTVGSQPAHGHHIAAVEQDCLCFKVKFCLHSSFLLRICCSPLMGCRLFSLPCAFRLWSCFYTSGCGRFLLCGLSTSHHRKYHR